MYQFLQQAVREQFVLSATLKDGPRGGVYLLQHKVSGRRYVLRSFEGSAQVYQRLLTIRCPNLPEVMEAAQADGRVLVLEEFVAGDNLAQLLREARFTPAQARTVCRQLCQALWVLHSLGAVHRDVKPENVILRGDQAVLIDFDASRLFKDGAQADTQVLGTTGYAPPEQYGLSQTDPRSDIYAMGVLLNVMLTGRHPSRALAPGRMGRVVQRCTMMAPDKRYQSALDLMDAL